MEGARPWSSLAADAGLASGETDADGEEAPGARGRAFSGGIARRGTSFRNEGRRKRTLPGRAAQHGESVLSPCPGERRSTAIETTAEDYYENSEMMLDNFCSAETGWLPWGTAEPFSCAVLDALPSSPSDVACGSSLVAIV